MIGRSRDHLSVQQCNHARDEGQNGIDEVMNKRSVETVTVTSRHTRDIQVDTGLYRRAGIQTKQLELMRTHHER